MWIILSILFCVSLVLATSNSNEEEETETEARRTRDEDPLDRVEWYNSAISSPALLVEQHPSYHVGVRRISILVEDGQPFFDEETTRHTHSQCGRLCI